MSDRHTKTQAQRYVLAGAACLLTASVAALLHPFLDLVNIAMVFLLTVFLVARRLGRGPAVMAAFLCVALFDLVFVPPRFSFAVNDVQYLVTFAVMLAVGLATAELTTGLQIQAETARQRELQAQGLYELARELAGVISLEQLAGPLEHYLDAQGYEVRLHLLDDHNRIPSLNAHPLLQRFAMMAIMQQKPVEMDAAEGRFELIFPLRGAVRVRGIMILSPKESGADPNNRQLLGAVASLVALTVDRLHYVEVAQATQLEISDERLRTSILSALSHDLRTPVTALVGMADTLAQRHESMDEQARSMAAAIREQARAMGHLLSNLLDMAKLQAGKVQLHREWQLFEEVISSSLNLMRPALEGRQMTVEQAADVPLMNFDAVLLERVICNLLENAAKYSPPGTPIVIQAFAEEHEAGIAICDQGQGFPEGQIARVFGMFERGQAESSTPGVGLGLAICRAIIEAHGGTISAVNRPSGGACVTIRLPRGTPPSIEDELPDADKEMKT